MVIEVDATHLRLRLSPIERLLAGRRRSELVVPLERIEGVSTRRPDRQRKRLRWPGTHIPSLIKAGTYVSAAGREFWYVTRDRDYLVVSIAGRDERYCRLVLTLDGARDIALALTERIR